MSSSPVSSQSPLPRLEISRSEQTLGQIEVNGVVYNVTVIGGPNINESLLGQTMDKVYAIAKTILGTTKDATRVDITESTATIYKDGQPQTPSITMSNKDVETPSTLGTSKYQLIGQTWQHSQVLDQSIGRQGSTTTLKCNVLFKSIFEAAKAGSLSSSTSSSGSLLAGSSPAPSPQPSIASSSAPASTASTSAQSASPTAAASGMAEPQAEEEEEIALIPEQSVPHPPVEIEMTTFTSRSLSHTTTDGSSSSAAASATNRSSIPPATKVISSLSAMHASSELVAQIRAASASSSANRSALETQARERIRTLEDELKPHLEKRRALEDRLELLSGGTDLGPTTTRLRDELESLEKADAPLERELESLRRALGQSKPTASRAPTQPVSIRASAPVSDVSTSPDKSIQIAQDRAEVYLEAITFFGIRTDTKSRDQVRSDIRNATTPKAATAALDRAKSLWREELRSYKTQLERASSSEIELERREIEAYCDLVKRFSEKAFSTGIRVFYEDAQEALRKVPELYDQLKEELSRTGETLESKFPSTRESMDHTVTQIAAARVALDRFDTQEKTCTALAYLKVLPFITTDQNTLIEESKTALRSPSNNAKETLDRLQTALATEMSKAKKSMGITSAKFKLLEVKRYAVASFYLAKEARKASNASNPVLAERLMESSQAQLSLAERSKNGLQDDAASKAEEFIAQAKAERQTASATPAKAK